MGRPTVTEDEIIQMTLKNVRSFYNRNRSAAMAAMAEDFMWIGSNDLHWSEGLEEYIQAAGKESEGPPVLLSDEEYHLLFHERNVWVLFGRYQITTMQEDGSVSHAHVRGTYIWRRINGELKLSHIHLSHAQDIPLNQQLSTPAPRLDTDYLEYMKRMDVSKNDVEKLVFRDREKHYRYLLPSEILYLQAALQWTVVYTQSGSFQTWGILAEHEKKMPAMFQRIHKSYLVNTIYIDHIRRYQATLKNGQELPIGKERYMTLKHSLQHGLQTKAEEAQQETDPNAGKS